MTEEEFVKILRSIVRRKLSQQNKKGYTDYSIGMEDGQKLLAKRLLKKLGYKEPC